MGSKIARRLLEETPAEVRIFVRKYGDIVVRVHQLLREKGWTQKDLARKMEKTPSEISKWLNGDHNFTLRSLAKLEAELGTEIIYVPKRDSFHVQRSGTLKSITAKAEPVSTKISFQGGQTIGVPSNNKTQPEEPIAA
jgi:transcriptional regulator with XRE-family HTH domain